MNVLTFCSVNETDRQTDRDRDRETETERQRQTDRETDKQRERERKRKRVRGFENIQYECLEQVPPPTEMIYGLISIK